MWHKKARHCPLCAAELVTHAVGGRVRVRCVACAFVLYENPASAAAGVVFNPAGEILLVRRAIEPYRDHWALPAGYQEIDETPQETVVREIREEAGIVATVLGLLDYFFVADDPRKPANVAVFLCRTSEVDGARPGGEEVAAGFFPLDALPDPIGFDNYPRILSKLGARERYPDSAWDLLRDLLP